MNYDTIVPYAALLREHPLDFAYYGKPKDAYYDVYETVNENNEPLVVSYECSELCEELAFLLKDVPVETIQEEWVKEEGRDYDCMKASEEEVQSLVLSLIDSLSYNDAFLLALQNGLFIRLLEALLAFSQSSAHS